MDGHGRRARDRRRLAGLALVGLLLLSAGAAAAEAEAPSREQYVSRLEAICKPGAEATQRAMVGARADVKAERLDVAAGKFAKASSIFESTVKRIGAVPRPPADRAKLSRWFGFLGAQASYLRRITAQLRADRPIAVQRLTAHFIQNGRLANSVALPFGFDYCSFKFSRYG
jgi:hypothetical protein